MYQLTNHFPDDVKHNVDVICKTISEVNKLSVSQLCWSNTLDPYCNLDLYSKAYMYTYIECTNSIDDNSFIDVLRSFIDQLIPSFSSVHYLSAASKFIIDNYNSMLKSVTDDCSKVNNDQLNILKNIHDRLSFMINYIYDQEEEI